MAKRVFLFRAPFAEEHGIATITVDADSNEQAAVEVDNFFADYDRDIDWRGHLAYVTTPEGESDATTLD